MKIKFKSTGSKDGENNVIEFDALVSIDKYEQFDTYEFLEPSQNIMNRIEVSQNEVNIIAGMNTIQLTLNEKVPNLYATDYGNIDLVFYMKKLERSENFYTFEYDMLDANANLLFSTVIELTIY